MPNDKRIVIRSNDELESEIEYLKKIYGIPTTSKLVKMLIEKEYRKEREDK